MKRILTGIIFLLCLGVNAIAQGTLKDQLINEAKYINESLTTLIKMLPKDKPSTKSLLSEASALNQEFKNIANDKTPDESKIEQLRNKAKSLSEKIAKEAAESFTPEPKTISKPPAATQGNALNKARNVAVPRSANIDTVVTFTASSFAEYCNTWKIKWQAKMLRQDEKQKITSQAFHLSPNEPLRTDQILDESSAGAMMVAGRDYANLGVYYIFNAGSLLPANGVTVSNVGGLLRMMDAVPEAVKVLLYGYTIDPTSVIILVQLANSLLEYGDDKKAEYFFKRCLRIDEDYPPAHKGMAAVYFKRGKWAEAYEELLRGATVGFNLDVPKSANEAKQECGFGDEDENGNSPSDFPYEKAKQAISSATRYISVSSAVVTEQVKMNIPQFPKFEGPEDYCKSAPGLSVKLLTETINNEQKFMGQGKSLNGANENPMYALEDFMFGSINDVYYGLAKKIGIKYRKEKLDLEERVIKEMADYNKIWTTNYQNCIKNCEKAKDEKCMKNCFCSAMMDTWHNHRDKIKNLYQQWKNLTVNLGNDLQKLQDEYYEVTTTWMNRVYDKPMYERMDLTRAGFSNSLITTFVGGLNFTSYFCENGEGDMDVWCAGGYQQFSIKDIELDKPQKNKPVECPKDKNLQITIMKIVAVSLECDAVGLEYFNSNTGTSPWVAGKYNWKKNQLTTIAGVGAAVGGGGFTASGSAKIGIINTMDFNTNEVDGGIIGKLDYSNEGMLANSKKGYSMEAKAMLIAGTEVSASKTATYGNDGVSVKYSSKSKTPTWDQIIK